MNYTLLNQIRKAANQAANTLLFIKIFSLLLIALTSIILISTTISTIDFLFLEGFTYSGNKIPEVLTNAISNIIVALAIYELHRALSHEHRKPVIGELTHILRRSTPRFIVVVCVALSLEGLIFVIKFGQAGKIELLIYPAMIILCAAFLLFALGLFLRLTPEDTVEKNIFKEEQDSEIINN